ncbi:XTP/dITP diphosphatase [Weissella coleopterorum]|uniref:dITP/XTP pyrophosphatase n=1 Tax=Weissella coleopterorum TaxID=2714949 RepID=A0A6G8B0M3_9LACO|nr:XTP/dITP diphosphatase [Weissella coleopterorum]QIL50891.1 XTP/dITP diphosphatase [Weissella coleopterorum]
MRQLIVATKNKGKALEISTFLAPFDIEVLSLNDLKTLPEIVEDGNSFAENAMIKAETICEAVHLPVLADDSGLMIEALDGEPGIYSARYAGDHDDAANNQKVIKKLKNVPEGQRQAAFHTVIVGIKPDGGQIMAEGQVNGIMLDTPQGTNGFGYDPLFFYEPYQKTLAQMSAIEKNKISHRGKALEALARDFKNWW